MPIRRAPRTRPTTSPRPSIRLLAVIATVVAATMVSQAFGRFTYALVLPAVQDGLDITYTLAGALGTANLAAYLLGSGLVAWLSTRTHLDRILKGGILVSTLGLVGMWWSPDVGVVTVAMLVTGVAGAAIWIPAPAVVSSLVDERFRGVVIGLVTTGIGIGFVTAGWAARATDEWRSIYGTEAVVGMVTTALVFALVRRPAEPAAAAAPSLRSLSVVPRWRLVLTTYAGFGLSMSLFVNFLVARLEEDAGWRPAQAATVFAIFGGATVLGGPIFGRVSDRIGRPVAMAVGFAAMAIASLLALAGTAPWPWVAAVIFGLAFAGVPTTTAALLRDHLTPRQFGSAFGVITLGFGAGQLLAPLIGGAIGDTLGRFTLVFQLAALVAVSAAIVSSRMTRSPALSHHPGSRAA